MASTTQRMWYARRHRVILRADVAESQLREEAFVGRGAGARPRRSASGRPGWLWRVRGSPFTSIGFYNERTDAYRRTNVAPSDRGRSRSRSCSRARIHWPLGAGLSSEARDPVGSRVPSPGSGAADATVEVRRVVMRGERGSERVQFGDRVPLLLAVVFSIVQLAGTTLAASQLSSEITRSSAASSMPRVRAGGEQGAVRRRGHPGASTQPRPRSPVCGARQLDERAGRSGSSPCATEESSKSSPR